MWIYMQRYTIANEKQYFEQNSVEPVLINLNLNLYLFNTIK